jgi:hypothetical protein
VRCAPGMACARSPSASTLRHTAVTWSDVAEGCITINIRCFSPCGGWKTP